MTSAPGPDWWKRLSPLVIAMFLIVGATVEWGSSGTPDGKTGAAMLFAVGLVILGIWLANEALSDRDHNDDDDDIPPTGGDPGS